jgi:hypothetical protein
MEMRQNIGVMIVIVAMLAATGCATLPKPEEMKADVSNYSLPKLPEPGKAIVYVVRPSSLGTLIRFNVFVDDKEAVSEMGYTRGSEYIYFNLTPGEHQILSKAENWASVNVVAKAGDVVFIHQEPNLGFFMARNELRIPEDYEGKYHVKHLTLGKIIKSDK